MLKAMAVVVLATLPLPVMAAGWPAIECTLSSDKSSMIVMGANSDDQSYACTAWCRVNVTGQRALERFECSFTLVKNAAEKAVCTRAGGAPKFFSAVSPTKFTCVPKN